MVRIFASTDLMVLAVDDTLCRKRRYYQLAPNGQAALREKRRSWDEMCCAVNRILEKTNGRT